MMTKFPPIIDYSLKPFAGPAELAINFTLPIGYQQDSGDQIEYKILNNKNNQSILESDGTIVSTLFSSFEINGQIGSFSISIPQIEDDTESILKLQLRFANGITNHSEWSTVCYLKQIIEPTLSIVNAENGNTLLISESPVFYGICNFNESAEVQDKYCFVLKDIFSGEEYNSGWLNHNLDKVDSYVFSHLLNDFTNYRLTYTIRTKNNYEKSISADFLTSFYLIEDDLGLSINAKNNFENGSILLDITNNEDFIGNLMIRRTSDKSNYTIWEDLSYLSVLNRKANISYEDFYIESGTTYKYGIQKININGYRSYLVKSKNIKADFEDIFLVSNGESIKIKYNPQVNNLKRNLLEIKQDTIGNKYPFILKNGHSNYFSFTLGGLISYYAENENNLYRLTTAATSLNEYGQIISPEVNLHTLNLTNENIYNERLYRSRIESFLTNGKAKLFKSPVEGNMVIYLMQVSLSPKNELGRMLYSFTSTAYEIAEGDTLQSLTDLNIYNKGQYLLPSEMGKQMVNFNYETSVTLKQDVYSDIEDLIYAEYNSCFRNMDYIKSISLYASLGNTITVEINGSRITITENGYNLNDILNITSMKVVGVKGSDPMLYIEGIAVASFIDKNADNESYVIDLMTYMPVTNIGQFANNTKFSQNADGYTSYSLDLKEAIEQKYAVGATATIKKLYSISYLKIQSNGNPFKIWINKETEITVVADQATILKYPITSCIILGNSDVMATVDFIYNGYKYAI